MEDEYFNLSDLNLEESTMDNILGNTVEEQEENPEQEQQENTDQKPGDEIDSDPNKEVKGKAPSFESQEDSSTFSVFANLLKEEGVISLEDEDLKNIKTSADLVEAMKKQIENSKYSGLTPSQVRYLEAAESGIPQSDYEKIEKQLSNLEKITDDVIEEDKRARFDLIAYDWIERGIDRDKAIELANRSIKLGTDIDDAKEALSSLIKYKSEEYKKTILSKQEDQKISLDRLKEEIEKKDFILKDIKQTPKQKADLYNMLSTKVDIDPSGQPVNEFNKWRQDNKLEAEIILGAIYMQTNKFKDLGNILQKSTSKAALALENKLRQNEVSDTVNSKTSFGLNKNYEINI